MLEPTQASLTRIRSYINNYRAKTGTNAHPDPGVTQVVEGGLAIHLDVVGKPLCPCNFYPDKAKEVAESRRWICACDEMKRYKYCHCLLFVTPDGLPITEYLPAGHEGRQVYGLVQDPTPDKGREGVKAIAK
jgi:ferredoxin-thioredoxin reductase catalytic chain